MTEITERLRLPPEPSSARAARQLVASALGSGGEVADLAVLLVSELASNVVLHAHTPMEVIVKVDDERLRVEVVDGDPALPALRNYMSDSVTGRGLHLVAATAQRWGFERLGEGKVVWFELDR